MDLENGEPPKLYGVNLQPPAPFDFANPATWSTWLSRYEDFTAVSGLTKASEDVQVRSLLYCMGPEARPLLETLSLDAESLASYQVVAARFTEHFVHPANELYESSRFHRRVQLPGESVDAYYAELCRMAKRCNYQSAAVEERLVRDRFVVGLRDSRLSDQLCRNAKLTLKEAWTQARQSEDADKEKELTQNRTEHARELNLDAAKASKFASRRRSGAKPTTSQPPAERSREPSTFCRSRKHQQNKLGSVHLHAVGTPAAAKFVDVTVDNYTAQFKVDSGAEVSAVPSDFPTLPAKLDKVDSLLTGPGGQPLRVLGSYLTPKATLHAELFKGLGTLKDEYVIRLKPDAVPFSLSVPIPCPSRRIPIPLLEVVRRELDKLESAGVIRRIDKPTPWCSGLVVVRKDDGSYRLCVDLTQLNKVVLRERHILPTVEQVLGLLGDATVFSRLDGTASFHQVKLSADSQELTTFITPYGRYCFCRLPFGITSAPEYFQKQMARILEGQEGVANMIDDILVFGRTRQEHDARLSQVLSRLAKAGITLNEDKCRFGVSEVSFLGVVVSAKGIRPDPSKVEAVKAMEAPTDVAGVRRLLGMVNHLARFLPHISDVTAPIRALLNKSASWAQESDAECKALIFFCQQGWPRKTKLPLHVSKYASVADELSVCDGILLKGPRIVIPSSLRPAVLTLLHEGHQGINRTKALARESVWWPGISADIASLVANCEQCAFTRVNLAEPLVSTALPGRPWEFLGMDLFHLNGQTFLLVVDYYSRFPEVVTLRSTTARAVIDALKSIFASSTIRPVAHTMPGQTERQRGWKDVVAKDVAYKRKQTDDYNRHHGARDLSPLETGQRVWVRPDQVQATVLSPGQRPRSYVVETDRGGVLQRNRLHLVPFVPSASGEESLPTAAQQPSPPQQVLQEPQPANSVEPAVPPRAAFATFPSSQGP
ncbi:uncharacterized protein LOC119406504 [Rhipicephalus sanguineus]|uniref:uncharacterized protein LOC119406504 n=1 Tax=Rhipicephalus sanguineus TaxID=34632 RepID=UPI0018955AA5|nr:uncharacterized protein LOC119406504 [Rhipicephalus sanguineus]